MSFWDWLRRILGGQAQPPTFPAPVPPPPKEKPKMSDRKVAGGKAHMTGINEKGPQGAPIKGERLREIRDRGDNGPSDGWYAFDCTPTDQNGKEFGPMPESEKGKPAEEQVNPEFDGVPTFDGSENTQALRLTWDDELTSGSADLVHEYANHGCTPRIKTVGARGRLTGLRFLAADGVVIPVRPQTLNIGRQEEKSSAGSAGKK